MASREVASRDFGETSPIGWTCSVTGDTRPPHREQNTEPSFNCAPHLLQNTVVLLADHNRRDSPDTAPLPSAWHDSEGMAIRRR
jgi:hypothetical protein